MRGGGPHGAAPQDPHGYGGAQDGYYHGELDASAQGVAQGDQYIYVTYPPDLKRRLLERSVPHGGSRCSSCYLEPVSVAVWQPRCRDQV